MPKHSLYTMLRLVFLAALCLTVEIHAEENPQSLTVIMPQVRPPFDKVFSEILDGIQSETGGEASSIVLQNDSTTDDIRVMLKAQPKGPIIGLGNQAKKLLQPLDSQRSLVYGAVFLNPDNEPAQCNGISLTPSPEATLTWLRRLAPNITTVHAVYQDQYSGWLIDRAKEVVSQQGLKLAAHPVDNVRQAAEAFRKILKTADAKSHAIWLLQRDPSIDEKTIVPNILAQAWNRDFVVFSSNPSHVPRGALFALFPDNQAMGASLARLATGEKCHGIHPLEDLLIAVNVRTASHVGLNFSRSEEKQFDLIFPSR